MIEVYSSLDGFPSADEQPAYYQMLANIGEITEKPGVKLLIASRNREILGAVVFFGDMSQYGSGGTATKEKNACGFRLLAVNPDARGNGVGRQLVQACIDLGSNQGHEQVVIHSTKAMQVAWAMYEKMGFERSDDLDFIQEELPVYGFRLNLKMA